MPFSTTVYLFPTVENIPAMRGLASDLVTAGQASGRRLALHGSVISDDGQPFQSPPFGTPSPPGSSG